MFVPLLPVLGKKLSNIIPPSSSIMRAKWSGYCDTLHEMADGMMEGCCEYLYPKS